MNTQQYLVRIDHTSEFPEPITFTQGTLLSVGETYDGPEGWDNWLFCETVGQTGGWVPAQILERTQEQAAIAKSDYTAKELNVRVGDVLTGSTVLNGWCWCLHSQRAESGWVPLANLQAIAP